MAATQLNNDPPRWQSHVFRFGNDGGLIGFMTTSEAIEWIADLFEETPDNISIETKRDEMPAWDSLGILTLMARLDEDFEILLAEDEIQELRSVSDIIAVMQKNGKIQ